MKVLFIEPFFGGSHKYFYERIIANTQNEITLLSLPARHWSARMTSSAYYLVSNSTTRAILERNYDLLITTSLFPLHELLALMPKYSNIPKILYFHENQFAYYHKEAARKNSWEFGMIQIKAAMAADRCYFNSSYNLTSFSQGASKLIRRFRESMSKEWVTKIKKKTSVIGLPVRYVKADAGKKKSPLILWNHRWESDKNPEDFLALLRRLVIKTEEFEVCICGEQFNTYPEVFDTIHREFKDKIVHFGFFEDVNDYWDALHTAKVVISTSNQEFFGISIMEAYLAGAFPLLPDRLVYPELYGKRHLYTDLGDMAEKVDRLLHTENPKQSELDLEHYKDDIWVPNFFRQIKLDIVSHP